LGSPVWLPVWEPMGVAVFIPIHLPIAGRKRQETGCARDAPQVARLCRCCKGFLALPGPERT